MTRAVLLAAALALLAAAPARATFAGIDGDLGWGTPEGLLAAPLSGVTPLGEPTTLAPDGYGVHWSPDATAIVYASDVSGDPEVYRLDTVTPGARPQQLTFTPGRDVEPSFSADGASIAFMSDRSGNEDIWVMDADGGNQRQVTTDGAIDQMPEYSPVDRRIAFTSDRTGVSELWVINDDCSCEEQLTKSGTQNMDPSWSPDGTALAYAAGDNGATAIWALTLGSTPTIVTDPIGDRHPTWAPDGTAIAYDTPGDPPSIAIVGAATSGSPLNTGWLGHDPDWSVLRPVAAGALPGAGEAFVAAHGAVRFRLPGAAAAGTLAAEDVAYGIPLGTEVDAQPEGTPLAVDLDAAIAGDGSVLQTTATGGIYTLRKRSGALDFDLARLDGCPRGRRAGAAVLPRNDITVRRRAGSGGVSTRAKRRHVRTYTRDTEYRLVEACKKTTITVLDGKLTVRRTKGRLPNGKHKVVLRKGRRLVIR